MFSRVWNGIGLLKAYDGNGENGAATIPSTDWRSATQNERRREPTATGPNPATVAMTLTPAERTAAEERLAQTVAELATMKCARAWDLRAEQKLVKECERLKIKLGAPMPADR